MSNPRGPVFTTKEYEEANDGGIINSSKCHGEYDVVRGMNDGIYYFGKSSENDDRVIVLIPNIV